MTLGGGGIAIKLLTWLIVLLLLGVLSDRLIKLRLSPLASNIRYGWLAVFIIFVFSNGMAGSLFGTRPSFSPGLVYPLILLLILAIDSNWSLSELIRSIKSGILIVLMLGFFLLIVKPSMVLEGGIVGSLTLLPFRYWGASPHANALGSIAVLYLLLEILAPTTNKLWQKFGIAAALISIILAQSKTALLGLVFSLACLWIVPSYSDQTKVSRRDDIKNTLKLIFVMLLPILLYTALFIAGYESKLEQLLSSDAGKSVTTLTGRTRIWEIALQEWYENPIFGYGPELFSAEYRMRIGMLFAFHAHNQFIQTLAQSGLIGVAGLFLLLGALAFKLLSRAVASRGVSLALFAFLLIRCITEVPLRSGNMISGEYLYLLALVAIAMSPPSSLRALANRTSETRSEIN